MKFVFTTLDVISSVAELQKYVVGSRVNNVYDLNNKTYLIKLARNDEKFVVLLESGSRIHLTEFEWSKNVMPSGFSMKLRKHIKNKKLSNVKQLGMDRIVDFQFGFDEHLFHLIIELYDRGNMCLTDHSYTILHLLRPRTDANQDVRYAAHEKYPLDLVRTVPECLQGLPDDINIDGVCKRVLGLLDEAKGPWCPRGSNEALKPVQKLLSSEFSYGQPCVEHCCRLANMAVQSTLKTSATENVPVDEEDRLRQIKEDYAKHFVMALRNLLLAAYLVGTDNVEMGMSRGYIFGKKLQPEDEELSRQEDFQPFLFDQFRNKPHVAFPTFSKAVDTYFSKIERDKTTELLVQNENKANKKFENIKKDHELRLAALKADQEQDVHKAQLLEKNRQLVDNIILMINHALSNQLDWGTLDTMIQEARARGDLLASHIVQLNLQQNQITVSLKDPFESESEGENCERDQTISAPTEVVISLDLNALNNARKYYDRKRAALKKEEKTLIASRKALKSAAFKAQQTRKDLRTVAQITKIRKPMWFEKFFWFISSENYLVVAGRDSQQNEVLVKRHLGSDDIYVHADVHGASSVIVKARPLTTEESSSDSVSSTSRLPLPPPKTLIEAGTLAIVLSSAWNARVVTSAWWVRQDQVSKTAPSGEYLTTGAFMIRGRKNYLPPCHFMYGFGVLFKLDEESVEHHRGERRVTRIDPSDDFTSAPKTNAEDVPAEKVEMVESDTEFPDTQLRLNLVKDDKVQTTADTESSHFTITCSRGKGASTRTVTNKKDKAIVDKSNKLPNGTVEDNRTSTEKSNSGPIKRGQKSKLRKIKQKYGTQDEDERMARMKLLQGEKAKLSQHHKRLGPPFTQESNITPAEGDEENSHKSSDNEEAPKNTEEEEGVDVAISQSEDDLQLEEQPPVTPHPDSDNGDEQEGRQAIEDDWLRLMDTFTGQPRENDILLYAMPVCAPYSALQNYKYKLKLTPGTVKRGKAAKTALNCFLTDKSSSTREKELMRVMKGEDISRNFPGNVKITFPQGGGSRVK
ncbi:Nuclear export mediator factor NEMF [Clonorchis sinensis]|uniref:Nuclear export mediator factor NEMF n=2 Tax=Clonorchis sinensis TaxID=79923 RepID=A0A8T1MKK7_CLOSI|nr:Nuclear export mediator factor NEMF [Clonorchis sinensis]